MLTPSDICVLVGAVPYKKPLELYLERHLGISEVSWNLKIHEVLKPLIREWYTTTHKLEVKPDVVVRDEQRQIEGVCDMDAEGCPIVISSSGITSPMYKLWTPIPDYKQLEVEIYINLTRAKRGYLAALVGARGFEFHTIEPSQSVEKIIEMARKRWERMLAGDIREEDIAPTPLLRRLPTVKTKVELKEETIMHIRDYLEHQKNIKKEQEALEALKAKIIWALQGAELGISEDYIVTYKGRLLIRPIKTISEEE